ncbi:Prefoldin subunit 5 [Cladochytrium replicatum]|nr:Prefoldin subunit 5 [Cladochytrium replicatum]
MATETVDLMQLPLPQLMSVKDTMMEELEHLSASFAQLKQIQAKFQEGLICLDSLTTQSEGKTILVPLTTSLYVPGQLSNTSTVIVDVGTGYYVQKAIPDAKDFYRRKSDYLKANMEKLQGTISQRQASYRVLIDIINSRRQQEREKKN